TIDNSMNFSRINSSLTQEWWLRIRINTWNMSLCVHIPVTAFFLFSLMLNITNLCFKIENILNSLLNTLSIVGGFVFYHFLLSDLIWIVPPTSYIYPCFNIHIGLYVMLT
ncbi:hypothetical protein L9F63_023096, partial [Diploptera punctata]